MKSLYCNGTFMYHKQYSIKQLELWRNLSSKPKLNSFTVKAYSTPFVPFGQIFAWYQRLVHFSIIHNSELVYTFEKQASFI